MSNKNLEVKLRKHWIKTSCDYLAPWSCRGLLAFSTE